MLKLNEYQNTFLFPPPRTSPITFAGIIMVQVGQIPVVLLFSSKKPISKQHNSASLYAISFKSHEEQKLENVIKKKKSALAEHALPVTTKTSLSYQFLSSFCYFVIYIWCALIKHLLLIMC